MNRKSRKTYTPAVTISAAVTVVLAANCLHLTIHHNFCAVIVNEIRRIRRNTIGIVRGGVACHEKTNSLQVLKLVRRQQIEYSAYIDCKNTTPTIGRPKHNALGANERLNTITVLRETL